MQDRQAWIRHGQELRRPLLVNPALADEGHVVVVGAGLSGLTAAYRLREARPDVRVTVLARTNGWANSPSTPPGLIPPCGGSSMTSA